ncbi:hypothetical protein FUA26_07740 [Seonamhaeicola algicola]|uniref:Major royal jelly protein n=1 Tax=Seonamhaeicola algicola TaxID=1719036 RepID=A0A5C7AT84_9FLAO|nr:L-dopachrome tautomerase-related protein [Seonamhaeicola algicola]TXE11946.1 hypothetical protein FUA26_07740 [Seonamhaeicola algicola]
MKLSTYILFLVTILASCKNTEKQTKNNTVKQVEKPTTTPTNKVIEVAQFKGQQVTGVTVSNTGAIFVNFPRWRNNITTSVAQVTNTNNVVSYPNENWNSWKMGSPLSNNTFVCVQSVVAFKNNLYVLDTRNPQFKGVLDAPRIFVFNLKTKTLTKTYTLNENAYFKDSYINDLRIDKKHNSMYCTDSGHGGLVVINLETGANKRILNEHTSTTAEVDHLTFNGKKWNRTVHADGIALNEKQNKLYYHALSGYSLYAINTNDIHTKKESELKNSVIFEAKTAAPDGMIFDDNGNLYFADLENDKIMYRQPNGTIKTLIAGNNVKWADTFSIYNGYLYFTNSRINEVEGDISNMIFTLNKIKIQ